MDLTEKLDALQAKRVEVADQARVLARREFEARGLRADVERKLRLSMTKTDAEKEAKLHPDYLTHELATTDLVYAKAISEAEAERLRFEIQAELAAARAEAV